MAIALVFCACKKPEKDAPVTPVNLPIAEADVAGSDFVRAPLAEDAGNAPMRIWMRTQFGGPWPAKRITQLAPALKQLETLSPANMPNWVSVARDGRRSAEMGDEHAVRAACRSCHEQYSELYAATSRATPLPAGF